MKIVLLTDTHWGIRSDSVIYLDYFKKFYEEVFFPYIKKHKIQNFIHLGDLNDNRKKIGLLTLNRIRQDFLRPLSEIMPPENCHFIVGNHDTFWKSTNSINFQKEIVSPYGFNVYESTQEVQINSCKMLFVPWITPENREDSFSRIKKSKSHVCIGHFEFAGFEMYRGNIAKHGDDPKLFAKFHKVLSGHFHTKSNDSNIYYLGSKAQYYWSDYQDKRGFHVFDTETLELTFVENPFTLFDVIEYDEDFIKTLEIMDLDFSEYRNKYLKVRCIKRTNEQLFSLFLNRLESFNPLDVQVDDQKLVIREDSLNELETEEGVVDTLSVFKTVIEKTYEDDDDVREDLMVKISELYTEAQNYNI